MNIPVAVLASGEGTTAEAFIRACVSQSLKPEVRLVICSKEGAGIFERIERLNQELGLQIKTVLINNKTHPAASDERVSPGSQTRAEQAAILDLLHENKIELVLALGYIRRIGSAVVQEFGWRSTYTSPYQARMLNTHPGLLPETAGSWGAHVQEYPIEKGRPYSGQTLHIIAEDYDDGPIIAEHKVAVEPGDTVDTLFGRVQAIEKEMLPADVQGFILGREQYLQMHPNEEE